MWVREAQAFYRWAYEGGFALPAFNVCNLEMALAALKAAETERAPVILQTYPGDIELAGPGPLLSLLRALAEASPMPVLLHFDHGSSLEDVRRALAWGYPSVMYDGSSQKLEINLDTTARAARLAHSLGAALEAEVGRFGGHQGEFQYTDPKEALRMVQEARVDLLAVSVGSVHGQKSRLNLDLLRSIAEITRIPLVLHGGSGIDPEDLEAAAQLGVVKVNIGTALAQGLLQGFRLGLETAETHYGILKRAVREAKEVILPYFRLLGASGQVPF